MIWHYTATIICRGLVSQHQPGLATTTSWKAEYDSISYTACDKGTDKHQKAKEKQCVRCGWDLGGSDGDPHDKGVIYQASPTEASIIGFQACQKKDQPAP